jgi:hypothetical protein
MANILFPIKITFVEWASQVRIDLPNIDFPNPESEQDWMGWVSQLINLNQELNIPVPSNPTSSNENNWQDWAASFIDTIYNSS